jgi:hypothetical protein
MKSTRITAWTSLHFALLALVSAAPRAGAQPLVVTHLAGPERGGAGRVDGAPARAQFASPTGIALEASGQAVITDGYGTIRRLGLDGRVSTLAGPSAGSIYYSGAIDGSGNLYVVDNYNALILRRTPDGTVTTFAGGAAARTDGTGTAAGFASPVGIAYSAADGFLYVSDLSTIRRITTAGVVTTLAGSATGFGSTDGACASARFRRLYGMTVDPSGNLFVTDYFDDTVRRVALPACTVGTIAGLPGNEGAADGNGSVARFRQPIGVAADAAGNVYVADTWNSTIRRVSSNGDVVTLAGVAQATGSVDGTGSAARFDRPWGLAVEAGGTLLVADTYNNTVRRMTTDGVVTTVAGTVALKGGTDGTGSAARFDAPRGLALGAGDAVYLADSSGQVIRKVTASGVVTTVAGAYGVSGTADGAAADARFTSPAGMAVDASGTVYVADSGSHTIRKIALDGTVSTLAGLARTPGTADGSGSGARFTYPHGLAVDADGNVFVADSGNNAIRRVTPAGVVTTYAGLTGSQAAAVDGTAGPGGTARLARPEALAFDAGGNLFVADFGSATVRKITPSGSVTTVGGTLYEFGTADGAAAAARLGGVTGITVDASGHLYVTDGASVPVPDNPDLTDVHPTLRTIAPDGTVTTIAGTGVIGHVDGYSGRALLGPMYGIARDSRGRLIVGDTAANAVRVLWRPTVVRADFDADARSDAAVYRPSSGTWFSLDSSTGNATYRYRGWGVQAQGDTPAVGDFDGDGVTDPTVFRPASGTWFILESHAGFSTWQWFGWGEATDTLVPGDYDGDGITDAAVYRPSTGTWYVRPSSGAANWSVVFGQAGDVPVVGDFDGDGKRDPAVYRSSTGTWFWLESSTNLTTFQAKGWGIEAQGDEPAPGDFDGDGKTDLCVFRSSTGTWFILESHASYTTWNWFGWGMFGDQVAPADYDGDGKTDAAIYRPGGVWYVRPSSGATQWNVTFGAAGDVPLAGVR